MRYGCYILVLLWMSSSVYAEDKFTCLVKIVKKNGPHEDYKIKIIKNNQESLKRNCESPEKKTVDLPYSEILRAPYNFKVLTYRGRANDTVRIEVAGHRCGEFNLIKTSFYDHGIYHISNTILQGNITCGYGDFPDF